MSVQVEDLEKNMAKLTVEVPAEEFTKAIHSVYLKNKNQFNVPGFRRGKVPQKMIEQMYGVAIFYEDAVNELLPDAYEAACGESGLEIVSRPEIDIVQVESGKPLIFTAVVAVKPGVTLGQYKGIEYVKKEAAVTEEDITAKLAEEQQKNAVSITVEDRPAKEGDTVDIDFEGFVDGTAFEGGKGENYELVLGSGQFIPGFEDQLVGRSFGEEVDVNVTFPVPYQAKELEGKDALFKVKINAIRTQELPEIDDEFASEVSEFDTLEEYKADLRQQLESERAEDIKKDIENEVIDKVVSAAQMDIPQPMIEAQASSLVDEFDMSLRRQGMSLEQYMQYIGATRQQMEAQMMDQAKMRIEYRLTMEAIVAAEGIEATDEDLDAELAKAAEGYGIGAEEFRNYVGAEQLEQMREDIAVQKAVDLVVAAAVEVEAVEEEAEEAQASEEAAE